MKKYPIQISVLFKACNSSIQYYKKTKSRKIDDIIETSIYTVENYPTINVVFNDNTMDIWQWRKNINNGNPFPNKPDTIDNRFNVWILQESNVPIEEE